MSTSWRPIDGEEITPATPAAAEDDVHAAESSGGVAPAARPMESDAVHDHDDVSTRARRSSVDNRLLIIAGILVAVIAQLVVGFLALTSINQLRDQTTAANALQHCLISAQLKQVSSSDAAAYQSAVQACIDK